MSRAVIAFDRLAALVAGLLLLALGVYLVVWQQQLVTGLPTKVDLKTLRDAAQQPWWPWVVGLVGAALLILGLRWLLAHLPGGGVGQLKLAGSGAGGRLTVQAGEVAGAAADVLAKAPGVRSARGTVRQERGQLVARINATIEPEADLASIARAADRASADLRSVLERDDLHCSVQLKVAGRARPQPRVH